MKKVILKQNRKKRLEQGHPWVYKSEIETLQGEIEPGDVVEVLSHQGRFLASGLYNPQSQISVRIISFQHVNIDEDFFFTRIKRAWNYRQRLLPDTSSCRVVFAEADFLPGVIVDKFGDILVVQVLSYGMEMRKDLLQGALCRVFEPRGIYERNDVPVRELEGLQQVSGFISEPFDTLVEIEENGIKLMIDVAKGQKTGYFFDQRENRAALAPLMLGWGAGHGISLVEVGLGDLQSSQSEERLETNKVPNNEAKVETNVDTKVDERGVPVRVPVDKRGKVVKNPFWDGAEVLDCFAHTGAFALNACKYGAKKATCLDISSQAIESARCNATINGYLHRMDFVEANAFDYLRASINEEKKWDIIILDPPAFAKSRSALEGASRGYKDINLNAMKLLREGGYLVTASCSYHLSRDKFLQIIREAAVDAKKTLRLVEFRTAGKDHPTLLGSEETNYLKFAIFEVSSR